MLLEIKRQFRLMRAHAPVDGVVINTGTMFKYAPRASMVFGKVVETVNLNEYFK